VERRGGRALLVAALAIGSCAGPSTPSGVSVESYAVEEQPAGWLALPARPDSVKFAVIGDSGRGSAPQYEVAAQMEAYRQPFPFSFV
jgi:hypothetical protein